MEGGSAMDGSESLCESNDPDGKSSGRPELCDFEREGGGVKGGGGLPSALE